MTSIDVTPLLGCLCTSVSTPHMLFLHPQHTICFWRDGAKIWLTNQSISADSHMPHKHSSRCNRYGCATSVLSHPYFIPNNALTAMDAGNLGDPYLRQVPLPRTPSSRDWQESAPAISALTKRARAPAFMSPAKRALPTKYPTDTFRTILSVEPEWKPTGATRINTQAARLTRRLHMQYMHMNIPSQ